MEETSTLKINFYYIFKNLSTLLENKTAKNTDIDRKDTFRSGGNKQALPPIGKRAFKNRS